MIDGIGSCVDVGEGGGGEVYDTIRRFELNWKGRRVLGMHFALRDCLDISMQYLFILRFFRLPPPHIWAATIVGSWFKWYYREGRGERTIRITPITTHG